MEQKQTLSFEVLKLLQDIAVKVSAVETKLETKFESYHEVKTHAYTAHTRIDVLIHDMEDFERNMEKAIAEIKDMLNTLTEDFKTSMQEHEALFILHDNRLNQIDIVKDDYIKEKEEEEKEIKDEAKAIKSDKKDNRKWFARNIIGVIIGATGKEVIEFIMNLFK